MKYRSCSLSYFSPPYSILLSSLSLSLSLSLSDDYISLVLLVLSVFPYRRPIYSTQPYTVPSHIL